MNPSLVKRRLKIAIFFTLIILGAEFLGGIWANSLALLSDAAHLFMDLVALCLTWFALIICERPSTNTKTFGYHRIETFAAFLNGLLIFGIAFGILFESIDHFLNPQEVQSAIVIWVATIGLIVNLAIMYSLRKPVSETQDLNIKSAFYHILGDSLASVGVILGGLIIQYTGWYQVDAVVSLGIGLLILWGTFKILSESIHILLEGVPKGVSLTEVENAITAIPAVKNVHELHIWCICSNIYALSTHALVQNDGQNKVQTLLEEIRAVLKNRFNIAHSTIQLESISCGKSGILCEMKH